VKFSEHAKEITVFSGKLCSLVLFKGTFVWKSVLLQRYILHIKMTLPENGSLELL